MSIVNLNDLTDSALVAQYVVELFGHGHFLSRDDHARISGWLSRGLPVEEVLLILTDVLPPKVEKSREKGKKVFSLSAVGRTVERRIKNRLDLVGATVRV